MPRYKGYELDTFAWLIKGHCSEAAKGFEEEVKSEFKFLADLVDEVADLYDPERNYSNEAPMNSELSNRTTKLSELLDQQFRQLADQGKWPSVICDVFDHDTAWPWGGENYPSGVVVERQEDGSFIVFQGCSAPDFDRLDLHDALDVAARKPRVLLYWADDVTSDEEVACRLSHMLDTRGIKDEEFGSMDGQQQAELRQEAECDALSNYYAEVASDPLVWVRVKCVGREVWAPDMDVAGRGMSAKRIVELLDEMYNEHRLKSEDKSSGAAA